MNPNELAMLTLAAHKPLKGLGEFHLAIAARLAAKGLLLCRDGHWYPTAAALAAMRVTVH